MDSYRSIAQCVSFESLNLVSINVTNAIKYWKPSSPFALEIRHKGLKKAVDHYRSWFHNVQEEFLNKSNKKIELAFSVLLIAVGNQEILVTFGQLMDHLEKDTPLEGKTYRNEYQPYEEQVQPKEQPRKDHNIVVEARLVRLLKRSKGALKIEWLSRESGYEESVVALAMKRLCKKGLAEVD